MSLAWIYLTAAGLLEVLFALSSNAAEGYTRLWPSLFNLIVSIAGVYLLSLAMLSINAGIAYAILIGIGAIGSVVFGALLFHESFNTTKLIGLTCIIAGVAGLHVLS